jgi:hypothetical protein
LSDWLAGAGAIELANVDLGNIIPVDGDGLEISWHDLVIGQPTSGRLLPEPEATAN